MAGNHAFKHGGNVYDAARRNGGRVSEILDFSANINPLGMPGSVRKALLECLENVVCYPDPDAVAFKKAVARYYGVDESMITAGNGAVELLYILCHTLKPNKVLIPAPTFSEYEAAARAAGAAIEYVKLMAAEKFIMDFGALVKRLEGADMIFICNPNNPTGVLTDRDALKQFLEAAAVTRTTVVIDESFLDFLPDDSRYSCRPLLADHPNLVVICSLTKFYAIPGLRLGFCLAYPELTRRLHGNKDPWNVNTLAQCAGVAALQDKSYQEESRIYLQNAMRSLYLDVSSIPGITAFGPSVNFILADIADTGMNARRLSQKLAMESILVRDCSNYPGLTDAYIRIAVKRHEQNLILTATLRKILAGDNS
jgi:threonine-phosphate decarboxylase